MKCNILIIIIVNIIMILIILLIFYLYYIDFYRYCLSINNRDLSSLDKNYLNLPRVKSNRKVVISLTTIPERIDKLQRTLASLLYQSNKVDEIYINIPHVSLKGVEYKIPKWLSDLNSISINWINKDYGPASKLLPSLIKEDKDTIIVVVDDDTIYGSKMVELYVYTYHQRCEQDALTTFGWSIDKNLNIIKSPSNFLRFDRINNPYYIDLLGGSPSFLVTPRMFPSDIFDFDKAPEECMWVDDILISGWLTVNKIRIYSLGFTYKNIPILDIYNMDPSVALSTTKNLSQINENIVIKWFHDMHGIWHKN